MSKKKINFGAMLAAAEGGFDQLKQQWQARFGTDGPQVIVPYHGYGSDQILRVNGRVLINPGSTTYQDNEDIWDSLWDMYRRFESDEMPFPRVRAQYKNNTAETTGDEEGFFLLEIPVDDPAQGELVWREVELTLLAPEPESERVQASGKVMVPPQEARLGVISDIDDTVIYSHATDFIKMARTILLEDAAGRTPFPGVSAFYRALSAGMNPLFYVSSSPWNMYDLFLDLFELQKIPQGPLFLRDWGIKPQEYLPRDHRTYKLEAIRSILDFYAHLPFILIGDSGQEDPEIYHELIALYPGRIQAAYIRLVDEDPSRAEAVRALAGSVRDMGTPIILASDTLAMAGHAAKKGWITRADVRRIKKAIAKE